MCRSIWVVMWREKALFDLPPLFHRRGPTFWIYPRNPRIKKIIFLLAHRVSEKSSDEAKNWLFCYYLLFRDTHTHNCFSLMSTHYTSLWFQRPHPPEPVSLPLLPPPPPPLPSTTSISTQTNDPFSSVLVILNPDHSLSIATTKENEEAILGAPEIVEESGGESMEEDFMLHPLMPHTNNPSGMYMRLARYYSNPMRTRRRKFLISFIVCVWVLLFTTCQFSVTAYHSSSQSIQFITQRTQFKHLIQTPISFTPTLLTPYYIYNST